MQIYDPVYVCDTKLAKEVEESAEKLKTLITSVSSGTLKPEKLIAAWNSTETLISTASSGARRVLMRTSAETMPAIVVNTTSIAYTNESAAWLSATRCLTTIVGDETITLNTSNAELIMLVANFIEIFGIIQEKVEVNKARKQWNSSLSQYFDEQIACLMAAAVIIKRCSELPEDDPMRAIWLEALEVFSAVKSTLWDSLHRHIMLMYTLALESSNTINNPNHSHGDSQGSIGSEDGDVTTSAIDVSQSATIEPAPRTTSFTCRDQTALVIPPATTAQKLLHACYTCDVLRQLLSATALKATSLDLQQQLNRSVERAIKISADSSGKFTSGHTSVDTTSLSSSIDAVNSHRAHFIELASAPCMMQESMYFASVDDAENASFLAPTAAEVTRNIYAALHNVQQVLTYVRSLESDAALVLTACRCGSAAAVCALLSAYPLMVHTRNEDNQTILHRSVMLEASKLDTKSNRSAPNRANQCETSSSKDHDEKQQKEPASAVVQALLTFPFNVDAVDKAGRTALHYCASSSAVAALCQHGADVNVADERGFTPLMQYVLCGYADCVRTILQFRADAAISEPLKNRNCLHFAATLGQYSMLEAIVASGSVDLNACDVHGNTALHLASACEFQGSEPMTMILYLVNHGADVNAKNNAGITMLHLICANQLLSPVLEPLVDMILHKGADPNATDADGCTPLIVACAHREFALCKVLLSHGGDLNIPCSMKSTFLTIGFVDGEHDLHDDNEFETNTAEDVRSTAGSQKSGKSNPEVEVKDAITATDLLPKKPRYDVFSSITTLQSKIRAVNRDRCMNCGDYYEGEGPAASFVAALNLTTGLSAGRHHCRHCRRVVCIKCASHFLTAEQVPDFVRDEYGGTESTYRVCEICYDVLVDRAAQQEVDATDNTTITTADGDMLPSLRVDCTHSGVSSSNNSTPKGERSPGSYFSFSAFTSTFKSVF